MNQLPKDPIILLSVLNMKLRDFYSSLDALCDDLNADEQQLLTDMRRVGYRYDARRNTFLRIQK